LTSTQIAFGRRVAVRENGRHPAFKMNSVTLLAGKARQKHTMIFIPPQQLVLRPGEPHLNGPPHAIAGKICPVPECR
jgi:hypothetical protein